MSDLTSCNYCNLLRLKRGLKSGERVILRPSRFMGGTEVFVVPKGIPLPSYREPSNREPNGDDNYKLYHRSWMMSIPRSCCC